MEKNATKRNSVLVPVTLAITNTFKGTVVLRPTQCNTYTQLTIRRRMALLLR